MPTKLRENISSKYVEAANRLRPKTARRRIVAYVEAYDDIFFWRSVLTNYEDDTRYFEVMLPTKVGKLERGKKAALMKMLSERVGSDMIACVDADYDYLEQGATQTSKTVNGNPYVFHTYAYAIENLQCYAPSLHDVCVAVTLNDRMIFDCEEYLRQYSVAVFPLFVWSIWHYRSPDYSQFSITDFLRVIEPGHFTIERAPDIIANVKRKVGSKIRQLQREHPDAKKSYLHVKDDILRLGVTPETTYLYIQGHHLFDKVVEPMLKKICDQLIRARQQEISQQSQHSTQRRNELSCYTSSIGNIQATLRRNIGYFRSEPFLKIRKDIEEYLAKR
ncbi:MAG: DUF4435 domain-containing protein [Prevotella sp.]|nr:DUF4435 domain-containing protein [Prevotella sp.]